MNKKVQTEPWIALFPLELKKYQSKEFKVYISS